MGMFDYVNYEAPCYRCTKPLDEFQSKDHECQLETLQPADVRRFYRSCPTCGAWNEYTVVATETYILRVRQDDERTDGGDIDE